VTRRVEGDMDRAIEETAALRYSGTDEQRTVTVTVDGTGAVVDVKILAEDTRRLRAQVFVRSLLEAFTRARHAAAEEERPALNALREQGVDIDALRRVLP
jgi:DNA-binding protein YbaB